MTRDDVGQWLKREPFVPFAIHTAGGRAFEVHHPEYAALGRTTMVLYFPDSDRWVELALFQIDTLEKLEAEAAKGA